MKKHDIKPKKVVICLNANEEEQRIFNVLRKKMQRNSNSDVIRRLIYEKYEFFCNSL